MNYPATIEYLIACFKKLPGVGSKTAERYALACLNLDNETISLFSESLKDLQFKVKRCKVCNNYTENEKCDICLDKTRDSTLLCIVQQPKNIISMEKTQVYNGKYHVINKLISPLDGVDPEDINILTLKERIKEEGCKEVVIALKQTVEGEITTLYIIKMLTNMGIKISKMAQGVPYGIDIDYIDVLTLEKAIEERKEIS